MNSPIDKVWEFYTDVKHLELVTPKEMRLKIINTTSEKLIQGSEIWLEAKLTISNRRRTLLGIAIPLCVAITSIVIHDIQCCVLKFLVKMSLATSQNHRK